MASLNTPKLDNTCLNFNRGGCVRLDSLTRKSVILREDYLKLSLPASKMDPFKQGVTLLVARANDSACTVRPLQHLFRRAPAPLQAPLFNIRDSFTRQEVTQVLRDSLLALGCTGNHSGHSFRIGAATSARDARISEDIIMLLGRCRSDLYKHYIETHPQHILAASRRLQGG